MLDVIRTVGYIRLSPDARGEFDGRGGRVWREPLHKRVTLTCSS